MSENKNNSSLFAPNDYFGFSLPEAAFFLLLLLGTHLASYYNYLLFHSAAELFSVLIAATVAIVAINCWKTLRNQYVLFIGIGYLFVGFLDILHTLAYKGMPIFKDYDYYAPQLWIAARYLESISMLIGFSFLGTQRRVSMSWTMTGYALITGWLVASIFYFKDFPICFVAGKGLTPFKVFSEYVICTIMLVNLILLNRRKHHFTPHVYRLLVGSAILMIGMELCFTLYFSDTMSDTFNQIGHLLKIGTFYLMYKAVIVTAFRDPMSLLFRELSQKEAELEARVSERTAQLSEAEYRWKFALEGEGSGVWDWNLCDNTVYFSHRWKEMLGFADDEIGNGLDEWKKRVHPDDKASTMAAVTDYLGGKSPFYRSEHRVKCQDGNYKWILDRGIVVSHDKDGNPLRMIGTHTDITQRKNAESVLLNTQQHLLDAQSIAKLGSWHVIFGPDASQDVWTISGEIREMYGHADSTAINTNSGIAFIPDEDQARVQHHWEAAKSGAGPDEWEHRIVVNGETKWVHVKVHFKFDDKGVAIEASGINQDITARKHMEEQIRQLAFYDPLTRLPNRRLLNDRLVQVMASSKRNGLYAALMFIDLDNFKHLNDTQGHEVGDLLLIEVAERLKGCIREMDTAARIGGDEFVVIISELDSEKAASNSHAMAVAEKIRKALAEPYKLKIAASEEPASSIEHLGSASIGVTLLCDHELPQDELLKRADKALYAAKGAGRNIVKYID